MFTNLRQAMCQFSAAAPLVARLVATVPLGYLLTALCVSGLASALTYIDMARVDAVVLMAMLGFVLYVLWMLWAMTTRSLARIYTVLVLASSVFTLAHLFSPPSGG